MLRYIFKSYFYIQKFNYTKEKAKKGGLLSTALYIAGACKRTLRVSQRTSSPGNPPFAKTRGGLRVIEAAIYRNGAIIGPVKFPTSNFFNQPVPHIHEFGGQFYGLTGIWNYPERSYMHRTLKQLQASGRINKRFSASMARLFN